jgi:hypothetical protein
LKLGIDPQFLLVMPSLVPDIHAFRSGKQDVDGRDKPGYDGKII